MLRAVILSFKNEQSYLAPKARLHLKAWGKCLRKLIGWPQRCERD